MISCCLGAKTDKTTNFAILAFQFAEMTSGLNEAFRDHCRFNEFITGKKTILSHAHDRPNPADVVQRQMNNPTLSPSGQCRVCKFVSLIISSLLFFS